MLQNVETAKRAIDAFNRRELDVYDELYTPDLEWLPAMPGIVEGGGFRGREGLDTYLGEVRNTWEKLRFCVADVRDLGDRVLVLGRLEGLGIGSGVPVDAPLGSVFHFRGGKISRVENYLDHREALQAAELAA